MTIPRRNVRSYNVRSYNRFVIKRTASQFPSRLGSCAKKAVPANCEIAVGYGALVGPVWSMYCDVYGT